MWIKTGKKRENWKKKSFQLGVKVEISLFLVKTYNVFQHETSDECMDECWKSKSPDVGSSGYNVLQFFHF